MSQNQTNPRADQRKERLARNLRANLKRRKSQKRERDNGDLTLSERGKASQTKENAPN